MPATCSQAARVSGLKDLMSRLIPCFVEGAGAYFMFDSGCVPSCALKACGLKLIYSSLAMSYSIKIIVSMLSGAP
eukprot:6179717-Pleurochrysis_carterae.AAC.6